MDLNDLSVDPVRLEQGDWVADIPELGDIRIKTRGLGNADWRRLYAKLSKAVPRNKKDANGAISDPTETDRLMSECLVQTAILDWSGLQLKGVVIPYSIEQARELIFDPRFRKFRDGCIHAAATVADDGAKATEDLAKN